ncbi:MAG: sigma-70 family RNA polymerase sigma factor [Bacteroidales bacterium]|nr:sigma-70 family RNA polymerase sigma factor [Bacteroidales bacterium]
MEVENVNSTFSEKAKADYKLVLEARAGSQRAFGELLAKYRESVYFMIVKMVRNPDDAEDLTIESFGKAFRNINSYLPSNAFSTWLFKIASNNTIDFLRSNKQQKNNVSIDKPSSTDPDSTSWAENTLMAPIKDPEESLMKEQKEFLIRNIVKQLHEDYRQITEMRYFDEMSYTEIAETLNLPLGTVKARLFRSRELLLSIVKNINMNKDKI